MPTTTQATLQPTRAGGPPPTEPRPQPHRGSLGRRSAPAPYRVAHDGGASLIRRSPHQKRTVTRGYWPPIPIRPAPTFEPPYGDEPGADEWYREAAGQLAFDFAALFRQRSPEVPVLAAPPPTRPEPLRVSASPEARSAARRFTRACLEILNGYRPAAHVRSLAQPSTAHTLIDQLVDALRRMPAAPRRQAPSELVKLRRLRVSEPIPGVVEAAAALGTDSRTWAMAFRLEHKSTTWLGTVLQVI